MTSRRKLLLEAITLLASDPATQLAYLNSLGSYPVVDELALDFDAIASARNDMLAKGEITAEEHQLLPKLDSMLDQMSGPANAALWTPEALQTHPLWSDVRREATQCLQAFSATPPNRD